MTQSMMRGRYSDRSARSMTRSIEAPIMEQDETVRDPIKEVHYKNTSLDAISLRSKKKHHVHQTGLYAHEIWRRLRDESKSKIKLFDLNEELQKLNYYDKVKHATRNEDEFTRGKNVLDMKRIKEVKAVRNEVELMYRSSKMNEDKFNVLRADSPLPDLNDKYGNESIQKYLPPLENESKPKLIPRVDSILEFTLSPLMKNKYGQKLMKIQNEQKETREVHTFIENQAMSKNIKGYQPVKIIFLNEKEAADPDWGVSGTLDVLESEKSMNEDSITNNQLLNTNPKHNESNLTDSSNAFKNVEECPPLSMNALIEYKKLLQAPGSGVFQNGKIKTFKFE